MRRQARAALVVLSIAAAACDDPVACTLAIEPAIEALVVDSVTGEPAAADALGVLVLGGEQLPMILTGTDIEGRPLVLAGGDEPGSYDVRIEKAGYDPWTRDDVEVESNDCGVVTERFEARLQPFHL